MTKTIHETAREAGVSDMALGQMLSKGKLTGKELRTPSKIALMCLTLDPANYASRQHRRRHAMELLQGAQHAKMLADRKDAIKALEKRQKDTPETYRVQAMNAVSKLSRSEFA